MWLKNDISKSNPYDSDIQTSNCKSCQRVAYSKQWHVWFIFYVFLFVEIKITIKIIVNKFNK